MDDHMDGGIEPQPTEERPRVDEHLSVNDVEKMAAKLFIPMEAEEEAFETFQWDIPDWKALDKRVTGPEFEIGGYKWRILVFPQGNNALDQVAVYLDSAEPREQSDPNWHVCAQFSLVMSNPTETTVHVSHTAHHRFTVEEADWGFTKFHDIKRLEVPFDQRGVPLIDKGHTVITAFVRVYKDPTGVLWHNFLNYDSKAVTGYVGLKNQGATCYMNSLLQSLYFTNFFRKAVFEIPTSEDEPSKSVALALQRVFYQLATSGQPVGTTELTKSFGWNSLESFMQHDVQEFNRVLQDNLEGKMKGTEAEGAIQELFVGKMKSYIKCIDVEFESSRVENFYDIQLNVKGCKTLRDSFAEYITTETLDGENKYQAEGHGLQDATKGVIFETLPPVLHLQLKRFEYDIERDMMVKINDRHEFPLAIDLADFVADGPAKDEELAKDGGFKYTLHGVLVHSGDLSGGHYFALIKPEKDGKWYKFDDDRVTMVTDKEVLDDNYGGGELLEHIPGLTNTARQLNRHKRFTNAYMLVYVRDNSMGKILKPLTTDDIPPHLLQRLDDERATLESRRKEREENLLSFNARVIWDADFRVHDGFDLYSPSSTTAGKLIKVRKAETFGKFKETVAAVFGVSEDLIRIWTLVKRQNDTIRTDVPIPDAELDATMEEIREKYGTRGVGDLKCFLELSERAMTGTVNTKTLFHPVEANTGNMMIFVKYYDPYNQTLEGVGKMFVRKDSKVGDIVPQLCKRKGLPENTLLKLFEEIKPTMIEPMKMKSTFHQCEIQGGDIIVFQKELTPKEISELQGVKPTIPQYFDYIHNRIFVEFRPKKEEEPALPSYTLELSKKSNYDQVAAKLAEKLNIDPLHIQFTSASPPSGLPKNAIKRSNNIQLSEMMMPAYYSASGHGVIYYEKLSMSIVELESKKELRVFWVDTNWKSETHYDFFLPKTSPISVVVEELLNKVGTLAPTGSQKLRIFSVFNGKLIKEFSPTDPISMVHDPVSLYVEHIPAEEFVKDESDEVISCFHFTGDIQRLHSVPFKIITRFGEQVSELKARIQERLGIPDKDFAKVKLYLYRAAGPSKTVALNDDDILSNFDITAHDSLGLDHPDKSGKSNRQGAERSIVIRG